MKKSILIVDDMIYMRMRIRKVVEGLGFVVAGEAENGEVAIAQYIALHPDLVLLDVTMPEMSGLEALKAIMKIDSHAQVIIVSGMGQKERVQEAILGGAKNYIMKPFNDEILCKVLTPYLK